MFPDEFIKERYAAEGIVFAIPAFRLGVFGQLYYGPSNVLSENLLMFGTVSTAIIKIVLVFQMLYLLWITFTMRYQISEEIQSESHLWDIRLVLPWSISLDFQSMKLLGSWIRFDFRIVDPDMILFQKMIVLSAAGTLGEHDWVVDGSFMLTRKLNVVSWVPVGLVSSLSSSATMENGLIEIPPIMQKCLRVFGNSTHVSFPTCKVNLHLSVSPSLVCLLVPRLWTLASQSNP